MRVLALSDIHCNIAAIKRIRRDVVNEYDLLIVAGDIGLSAASEIFDILDTFACPIAYIYGNHDHNAPYNLRLGTNGHHLHGAPLKVGNVRLHGFSGCSAAWGKNPVALRFAAELEATNALTEPSAYKNAIMAIDKRILEENRRELALSIERTTDPDEFVIVVTHDRLPRIAQTLPRVDLHIHGHRHKFSDTVFMGTRILNVAAVDLLGSLYSGEAREAADADPNGLGPGNYVTLEIEKNRIANVRCRRFGGLAAK